MRARREARQHRWREQAQGYLEHLRAQWGMVSRFWLWGLVIGYALAGLPMSSFAGMVGFPAAQLPAWHVRLELAGDSFKEELTNSGNASATTGRALLTVSLAPTAWSEVYARFGTAEFNLDEALFKGGFGLAYGGGLRLRLLTVPVGVFGLTGQYLRFTSDDDDSAGARVEGEWQEIDVALGFGTKRFGAFAFYVGGVFHRSELTLDTQGTGARDKFESEIPVRLLLGVHVFPLLDIPSGKFLVNVETRLIGETPQFTLGVQYAF